MQRVESNVVVSVSELKRNFAQILNDANDMTVAVLNHNRVTAYMVPSKAYEALIDRLDDLELAEVVKARASEKGVKVSLDDL
jgi:antitoxin StbD